MLDVLRIIAWCASCLITVPFGETMKLSYGSRRTGIRRSWKCAPNHRAIMTKPAANRTRLLKLAARAMAITGSDVDVSGLTKAAGANARHRKTAAIAKMMMKECRMLRTSKKAQAPSMTRYVKKEKTTLLTMPSPSNKN